MKSRRSRGREKSPRLGVITPGEPILTGVRARCPNDFQRAPDHCFPAKCFYELFRTMLEFGSRGSSSLGQTRRQLLNLKVPAEMHLEAQFGEHCAFDAAGPMGLLATGRVDNLDVV